MATILDGSGLLTQVTWRTMRTVTLHGRGDNENNWTIEEHSR
jgi:hypothetical protein